jgi:disulfide bond formation protein DsbB
MVQHVVHRLSLHNITDQLDDCMHRLQQIEEQHLAMLNVLKDVPECEDDRGLRFSACTAYAGSTVPWSFIMLVALAATLYVHWTIARIHRTIGDARSDALR